MDDGKLTETEIVRLLRGISDHLAALRKEREGPPKIWMTVNEVADELSLSRDTIERLIGSGRLKAAAIETSKGRGRRPRYRIRREWIDEFMQNRVRQPSADDNHRPHRRRSLPPGPDFIG